MRQTLKLGIPNGSLIDPNRGKLKEILDKARIFVANLESNASAEVTNIPWLEAVVQRPQELPYICAKGYCDAFFCGDDWAKEWELRGYQNKKLLGLKIGKVNIVSAAKPGNERFRVAASEYPFIAKNYLQEEFGAEDVQIIRYGEPVESRYVVIDSCGKTELKVIYGLADIIIDNTQSGSTLKATGLQIVDCLFSSECGLYVNDRLNDSWKRKKIDRLAMMLEGAVNAQEKEIVTLNARNEDLEKILNYIRSNRLFGDEETVIRGEKISEITIELPTKDASKPLIDTIGDLKDLGASCIEGIPLNYSIR